MSVALLAALAACGDGNPFDTPPPGSGAPGEIPDDSTNGIPEVLAGNLQSAIYNPADGTLQLELTSLDAGTLIAPYVRTPGLDIGNYQAFTYQQDWANRHFTALVAESTDPGTSVKAGAVSDGGQFNRFFSGAFYQRTGAYDPPGGVASPSGLVTYAGNYAGVTNLEAPGGPNLLPPPVGAVLSDLPAQSARTTGQIFLNVDFTDDSVNGNVSGRTLVDTATALPTIVLVEGNIAADGTFLGNVEYDGDPSRSIGAFGGVFGGTDAAAVGGVISLDQFFDDAGIANGTERERGVFVLIQCGKPGDDPACP
ncbi:thymidylate synthase [Sulfitobacter sp. JL08]|nr:thymidylate synthase [Sulfitobacter sp. JL08]